MKIKTMKELQRYAKEIYTDQDGIWVILKNNYVVTDDAHTIHGDTIQEILNDARDLRFVLQK